MSDQNYGATHSSDAATTPDDGAVALADAAASPDDEREIPRTTVRSGARIPRNDWRQGGRSVLRWRETLLSLALVSLGIGVLLGALLTAASPSVAGAIAGQVGLWIGMLVPIVWAFTKSRPAGLLRFRWLDVLWGVAFALALRLSQGWLAVAFGGTGALPSYRVGGGGLPSTWWLTDLLGDVVISPVIDEFFFRAVLVVAIFTVLRRGMGRPAAGVIAVAISAGVFALVSAFSAGAGADEVVTAGILSLVCGALVVLTGRLWGAIFVHVLYGATYFALALAGTFLA